MTKTFRELSEIEIMVAQLFMQHPGIAKSKFAYAYKRFHEKNYEPTLKQVRAERQDVYTDLALENPETKELLVDKESSRGFKFDRKGMKEVLKKERELDQKYENFEIEIEPYITEHIPEEVKNHEELYSQLTGLLVEDKTTKKANETKRSKE